MIRRLLRLALLLAVLGGVAVALTRLLRHEEHEALPLPARPSEPWPPLTPEPAAERTWVEPSGDVCPTSHPVKAKLASKIFHLPGMANYDRTKPDRCYVDATAAEGDGLRAAKR